MEAQEIFDTVARHLIEQGEPSISGFVEHYSQCRYRHKKEDGKVLKCSIGALIPDEVYTPLFETKGIAQLENESRLLTRLGLAEHAGLLRALQRAHDGWACNGGGIGIRRRMRKVANEFSLDPLAAALLP